MTGVTLHCYDCVHCFHEEHKNEKFYSSGPILVLLPPIELQSVVVLGKEGVTGAISLPKVQKQLEICLVFCDKHMFG